MGLFLELMSNEPCFQQYAARKVQRVKIVLGNYRQVHIGKQAG